MLDVVIVGAGPAGLMAARSLPKNFSFLVIDKKKEIGLPIKCGEGIREKEFIQLFKTNDFPFVRNTVHEHEIRYKHLRRAFKADYLQLDRPKFEQWLAKPIKDKIRLNIKCIDITIKNDFAEIITNSLTDPTLMFRENMA